MNPPTHHPRAGRANVWVVATFLIIASAAAWWGVGRSLPARLGDGSVSVGSFVLPDYENLGRFIPQDAPGAVYVCAQCHAFPMPDILPRSRWPWMLQYMNQMIAQYHLGPPMTPQHMSETARYYRANSPQVLTPLEMNYAPSPVGFTSETLGLPADQMPVRSRPIVANVNIVDLDQDGQPDVLVCDAAQNAVTWIRRREGRWEETNLAFMIAPAHTEVIDLNGDGHLDIVVAALGNINPSDEPVGQVVLLMNDGNLRFTPVVVLHGVPRVADVQPADLDGDGDLDLVVAMFGGWVTGRIGWLEQLPGRRYELRALYDKNGAIHVPLADINGDGHLDVIALVSQYHEEIVAFLGDGKGGFEPRVIYRADNPLFGSSGIQLVDLDNDGDVDILYSNGDALDIDITPKPYHGVQWLENLGQMRFAFHDITRFYGCYRAVAGDLDGDGDLDVVAASQTNDWQDPSRQSLIWLENDGAQRFTRHAIANHPTHLATAAVGDLDGDDRLDIVAGSMHVLPPFDRIGRVTLWLNRGRSNTVATTPAPPKGN